MAFMTQCKRGCRDSSKPAGDVDVVWTGIHKLLYRAKLKIIVFYSEEEIHLDNPNSSDDPKTVARMCSCLNFWSMCLAYEF